MSASGKGSQRSTRSWLIPFVNWTLGLAGLVVVGRGVWTALLGSQVKDAVALLSAGLVMMLGATVERFELLKGWGLEARIDRKIDEAETTLTHLRTLAATVYASLIQQSASAGRFVGPPTPRQLYQLAMDSRAQMLALGVSADDVRSALRPWVHVATWNWVERTASTFAAILLKLAPKPDMGSPAMAGSVGREAADLRRRTEERLNEFNLGWQSLWEVAPDLRLSKFRELVRACEDLNAQEVGLVLRVVSEWEPEIDGLVRNQELHTPARWFEYVNRGYDARGIH